MKTLESTKQLLLQNRLTLIGSDGLDNLEFLLREIKKEGIRGHFVETGVWEGGACIYAKEIIDELGLLMRVYVCDSFRGLPPPDPKYPADEGDKHHQVLDLMIDSNIVKMNFLQYSSLDSVVFVEGWFKDTMPRVRDDIGKIALLRLDGDMYSSTIEVLESLYSKVTKGGYVITDDYCLFPCREAIDKFRADNQITSPLIKVNTCIYYWKKE